MVDTIGCRRLLRRSVTDKKRRDPFLGERDRGGFAGTTAPALDELRPSLAQPLSPTDPRFPRENIDVQLVLGRRSAHRFSRAASISAALAVWHDGSSGDRHKNRSRANVASAVGTCPDPSALFARLPASGRERDLTPAGLPGCPERKAGSARTLWAATGAASGHLATRRGCGLETCPPWRAAYSRGHTVAREYSPRSGCAPRPSHGGS